VVDVLMSRGMSPVCMLMPALYSPDKPTNDVITGFYIIPSLFAPNLIPQPYYVWAICANSER
jgi:hypothetical protein